MDLRLEFLIVPSYFSKINIARLKIFIYKKKIEDFGNIYLFHTIIEYLLLCPYMTFPYEISVFFYFERKDFKLTQYFSDIYLTIEICSC